MGLLSLVEDDDSSSAVGLVAVGVAASPSSGFPLAAVGLPIDGEVTVGPIIAPGCGKGLVAVGDPAGPN